MAEKTPTSTLTILLDKLVSVAAIGSGISLAVVVGTVFFEVVMRKLGYATSWAYALSTYLQVYIVFLGLSWLHRVEGDIKVELLIERLPSIWQLRLGIFSESLVSLVTAVLAWQSLILLRRSVIGNVLTFGEVMIPVAYVQWTLPGGFILLFLVSLGQVIRLAKSKKELTKKQSY